MMQEASPLTYILHLEAPPVSPMWGTNAYVTLADLHRTCDRLLLIHSGRRAGWVNRLWTSRRIRGYSQNDLCGSASWRYCSYHRSKAGRPTYLPGWWGWRGPERCLHQWARCTAYHRRGSDPLTESNTCLSDPNMPRRACL